MLRYGLDLCHLLPVPSCHCPSPDMVYIRWHRRHLWPLFHAPCSELSIGRSPPAPARCGIAFVPSFLAYLLRLDLVDELLLQEQHSQPSGFAFWPCVLDHRGSRVHRRYRPHPHYIHRCLHRQCHCPRPRTHSAVHVFLAYAYCFVLGLVPETILTSFFRYTSRRSHLTCSIS